MNLKNENKRIIIFGGCGFLGLITSNLLYNKFKNIIILDYEFNKNKCPKNVNFIGVDLLKNKINDVIEINSNDVVINLASRQYSNPVPYFNRQNWFNDLNYKVSVELMQLCIKKGVSGYIFFSSDMVYGIKDNFKIKETSEANPIAEYGKSKLKAEKELRNISKDKIPLTIFRPRLISGPGRLGVFKNLFKLIRNSFPVPMIGNGSNCYQMVSVFDCAKAIELAIEKNIPNEIFNLASKKEIKVKKLISELIIHANSKSKLLKTNTIYIKPILNLFDILGKPLLYKEQYMIADRNIILDISKAKKILNWSPKFDDQQMINESYNNWVIKN